MAKTICKYLGGLRCEAVFESSGARILTDAPPENKGKGEYFSATDLVAASLGTCLLTMMGFVAEKEGIALQEAKVEVEKELSGPPYRIAKLKTVITMPAGLTDKQRTKLENFARTCPVHASLPAEMEAPVEFIYPD